MVKMAVLSAGDSTGTDQAIFRINSDIWLNLASGIVSTTNSQSGSYLPDVYTFDQQYDGQTAQQDTGRADATVFNTVSSLFYIVPCC